MAPYIDVDHVDCDGIELDIVGDVVPGFSWTARIRERCVGVQYQSRVLDAGVTFDLFQGKRTILSKDRLPVFVFASNDESVYGRCFTVETTWIDKVNHLCMTLFDSRLDAAKLLTILKDCAYGVSEFEIKMRVYQRIAVWPRYPAPTSPDIRAMLPSHRGSIESIDLDAVGSVPLGVRLEAAVVVDFGRMVIAVIDKESVPRICCLDNNGVWDDHPGDLFVRKLLRASGSATRALVACQNTPEDKFEIHRYDLEVVVDGQTRSDGSYVICAGAPLASMLMKLDLPWTDECFDVSGVFTNKNARDVADRRRLVACAEKSVREIVLRPEVLENIKRRIWRPESRLVRSMVSSGIV